MASPEQLSDEQREAILRRVDRYAHLMDASIGIPGTRWRIGWDGIIGLLPIAGDTAALLLSVVPLIEAKRLKVRRRRMLKMAGNIIVDYLVGLVPLVGDLFDFAYKANLRNAKILRREIERLA